MSSRTTLLNWRVWLGLLVTGVALWWTLRDVDFRAVGHAIAHAQLWIIVASTPVAVFGLWVRALRWRALTLALSDEPLPIGALFRATAVGFMAINLFPLRVGEIIRPWFLAQETGVRGSAALGTLILERAIDFSCVASLGALVLVVHGAAVPAWATNAALLLTGVSLVPYVVAFAMRRDAPRTLALLSPLTRLAPAAFRERALDLLTEICHGLASLRGLGPTLQVVAYSIALWGGIFAAPFLMGLVAFDVGLGTREAIVAGYTVTVFTALAAAAPSAPGFFGVFHFACREALDLFGVDPGVSVAYGTVVHLAYWIPVTAVGLLCAFSSGTPLGALSSPLSGKAPSGAHR